MIGRVLPLSLYTGLSLAACTPQGSDPDGPFTPDYRGVETLLLDDDLVEIRVSMAGARTAQDVEDYIECAAAQYALIRGYGFTRHLRTKVQEKAGAWAGDAVYTISPSLPRGLRTLDAEVVVQNCAENRIPTV